MKSLSEQMADQLIEAAFEHLKEQGFSLTRKSVQDRVVARGGSGSQYHAAGLIGTQLANLLDSMGFHEPSEEVNRQCRPILCDGREARESTGAPLKDGDEDENDAVAWLVQIQSALYQCAHQMDVDLDEKFREYLDE